MKLENLDPRKKKKNVDFCMKITINYFVTVFYFYSNIRGSFWPNLRVISIPGVEIFGCNFQIKNSATLKMVRD